MKTISRTLLLLAMITAALVSCSHKNTLVTVDVSRSTATPGSWPRNEDEAIAIASREIAKHKQFGRLFDCEAKRVDDKWVVIAWQVLHPERSGVTRSGPGAFVFVRIDKAGHVTVEPGY
ncbi:MAG: hypothetical protein NTY01_02185 [Verrucomicrobia bacterium]|nr:hypothetical protein [Verrucomicrobiota bacterium]